MNRIAVLLIGLIAFNAQIASASSTSAPLAKAIDACRTIVQPDLRLGCYDQIDPITLIERNKPRFAGKRSVKTEMFSISEPTVIRYRSDGAIFVLAIHDKAGEVVQNLHIGGSGEDQYLLERSGEYFLRVNGSTTWKIWLEEPVK